MFERPETTLSFISHQGTQSNDYRRYCVQHTCAWYVLPYHVGVVSVHVVEGRYHVHQFCTWYRG